MYTSNRMYKIELPGGQPFEMRENEDRMHYLEKILHFILLRLDKVTLFSLTFSHFFSTRTKTGPCSNSHHDETNMVVVRTSPFLSNCKDNQFMK